MDIGAKRNSGSSLFGVEMLSSTDGWAVGCTDDYPVVAARPLS